MSSEVRIHQKMALHQSENTPWLCICFKSFFIFLFFSQKKLQVLWREKFLTETFSVSKDVEKLVDFIIHVSDRNNPCIMYSTEFRQEKRQAKRKYSSAKTVHPVFSNATKHKCLDNSRAGKIKGKARAELKTTGPLLSHPTLGFVARHLWPALAMPVEDRVIASPLPSFCYYALKQGCSFPYILCLRQTTS